MKSMAAALSMLALTASGAATPEERFRDWARLPEAANVVNYRIYLRRQGVADAIPLHSLLRSARSWRECGAAEFALPPQAQWPHIVPTLRALQAMKAAGLVDGTLVASGYRNETLNKCAGGSSRSRHVANNALDFDLPDTRSNTEKLCAYWREHGPGMKLGLGFYSETKIHVDTSGFRTWGGDHTWRTSLCTAKPPRDP